MSVDRTLAVNFAEGATSRFEFKSPAERDEMARILQDLLEMAKPSEPLTLNYANGTSATVYFASASQRDYVRSYLAAAIGNPQYLRVRCAGGVSKVAVVRSQADAEVISDALHEAAARPEPMYLPFANGVVEPIYFATEEDRARMLAWLEENKPQGAPSPVAIVSMPTRKTTSTVARDGEGNITKTTQVEKDA